MIDARYCLISPCRDEARNAARAIESVLAQTVLPDLWVIVDDGSHDETPRILAEYAAKHDFIRVLSRRDRGYRKLGDGVIDAFYEGYSTIDPTKFTYLCKLDLDVELPPQYFELLIETMERNPRIGTISGKPYIHFKNQLIPEPCPDSNSASLTKFYRTECFRQIGGFISAPMWDLVDSHRCRMIGWRSLSIDEPNLRFVHLRPNIISRRDWSRELRKQGFGEYFVGTSPTYILASATHKLILRPFNSGWLALLAGYFGGMLTGQSRYEDHDFRAFLRRFHRQCLLMGKNRATERCDRQHEKIWQARASRRLVPDTLVSTTTI